MLGAGGVRSWSVGGIGFWSVVCSLWAVRVAGFGLEVLVWASLGRFLVLRLQPACRCSRGKKVFGCSDILYSCMEFVFITTVSQNGVKFIVNCKRFVWYCAFVLCCACIIVCLLLYGIGVIMCGSS